MDDPTQQMPPAAQPEPSQRRARRPWVLPAALGGLLLVGVLTAAVVIAGPTAGHRNADSSAGGVAIGDVASLDALFEPAPDELGADEPGAGELGAGELGAGEPGARERPFRHGRPGKDRDPLRLRDGEKVLAGSVGSVADGNLVVRKDNGAEVSVPTNGDTRVRGAKNKALSDLQAGERIIVKVGSDGVADGVLAVRAHAAGTVTAVDGDRATVVRPGGLSTVLDLSGVTERPAVGTVVVAVGTAIDDGATLKVEQIKELPTVG